MVVKDFSIRNFSHTWHPKFIAFSGEERLPGETQRSGMRQFSHIGIKN